MALTDSGDSGIQFTQYLQNVLDQDFTPALQITVLISYIIGFSLLIGGLTRLYHHGHGVHHQRVSPMGTAMYFVSGIVLISFMPYLQMISNSLFNIQLQSALMAQCYGASATQYLDSNFWTGSNDFCPIEAYSSAISAQPTDVGAGIQYAMFALLFLVGVIAFIRGMMLLIKIGEGGQGGHVGKAFTYIFAGIVGVNMDSVWYLFDSILNSNVPPSVVS